MNLKTYMKPNNNYSVERNKYDVLEVFYSDFTDEMKESLNSEVETLVSKLNPAKANTGINRDFEIKKTNAFAGVITEFATVIMFNNYFANVNAKRPQGEEYEHDSHVDIELTFDSKVYSVEVRSSFIDNGIEFALFRKNMKTGKQFFDVVGPYKNDIYKESSENIKDLYIRALIDNSMDYNKNFDEFFDKFIEDKISISVVGAATKNVLNKNGFYKTFNKVEEQIKTPGEYFVVELKDLYDVVELKDFFQF